MRTRWRLDALPATIGRALTNDVILDDPYVDAIHVRITSGGDGIPVAEDAGSMSVGAFKLKFVDRMSKDLVSYFAAPPMKDKLEMD